MKRSLLLLLVLVFALAACGGDDSSNSDNDSSAQATEESTQDTTSANDAEKLRIVTTSTQVTDAVSRVCGLRCEVISLVGTGVDPHLYTPTESDIQAMNSADAVFYNGLHLEGQFTSVFEALGETSVLTYAVATPAREQGLVLNAVSSDGTVEAADDPHIWNHPEVWALIVDGIAVKLGEMTPEHSAEFQANADTFTDEITAVFDWAQAALNQVPEEQRVFVTSHDAFQYYGKAFGWEVAAIQGISTEAEAGVGDIESIIDFIVEKQLPAIFVETSVPPNTVQAVIEGAAERDWAISEGVRELYSDSMGDPDTFAGTYVGMIATNTITILQSYGYDPFGAGAWPDSVQPAPPAELVSGGAES